MENNQRLWVCITKVAYKPNFSKELIKKIRKCSYAAFTNSSGIYSVEDTLIELNHMETDFNDLEQEIFDELKEQGIDYIEF